MTNTHTAIERFADWYRKGALPLWAKVAWDDTHGGFFESLDFDGAPINGPRRVRVQSRQVYTFTQAGLRGWHADAEDLAAKGFDYLIDRACPNDAARGCAHTLSNEGTVTNDKRDLYDQAFLLLACSARIRAGCQRAQTIANNTISFLDRDLASPHGGWLESDAGELPRRQNPHMHLFEAFMALYQATNENIWKERAAQIADLFSRHFYDRSNGVLLEFFTEDLTKPDPQTGTSIEPGHMMEWVWLLGAHERMGSRDYSREKQTLYKNALALADKKSGFLPDSLQQGDTPAARARRLWPQTEFIRGAFTLARDENDDFAQNGAEMIEALFSSYLDQPVKGLWCDQFNAGGLSCAKDVPASILYHLFEAVVETLRFKEA